MFYLILRRYVGADSRATDSGYIIITDSPATTNGSGEPKLSGWCGTTNDFSVTAHGQFNTLVAARRAAVSLGNGIRPVDVDCGVAGAIETYRVGGLIPLCREQSADWIYPIITVGITPDSTDADLASLLDHLHYCATFEGYILHDSVAEMLADYRDNYDDFN